MILVAIITYRVSEKKDVKYAVTLDTVGDTN